MNLSPLIKKVFAILFALNILLVAGNIILPKVLQGHGTKPYTELSYTDVNHRFLKSLHSFNLDDKWIIRQPMVNDSLVSYKVQVPKDLPVAVLLREITGAFDTTEAVISSKEIKIRGLTEVNIISGNEKKLAASFTYNDKINRRTADVGIIISAPELTEEIKSELILIPEKFLLLVIPSKESMEFVKHLRRAGKEYAILLNDDTQDLDYKLNPSYSMERLKISVRSLLDSFRDAVCYVYDPSSSLSRSSAFEYEKQQLQKRNIKLINYNNFPSVDGKNVNNNLRSYIENLKQSEKKLLRISVEDYFNALPEISAFWKRGYKFINPSLVL